MSNSSLTQAALKERDTAQDRKVDDLMERSELLGDMLARVNLAMKNLPPSEASRPGTGQQVRPGTGQPVRPGTFPIRRPSVAEAMGHGEERGQGDNRKATLGSQINGGGCLPPPDPPAADGSMKLVSQIVLSQLATSQHVKPRRQTAGYTSSAHTQMDGGVGRGLEDAARVEGDLTTMGATVRKGAIERIPGQRRAGESCQWATSSMDANIMVFGEGRALQ